MLLESLERHVVGRENLPGLTWFQLDLVSADHAIVIDRHNIEGNDERHTQYSEGGISSLQHFTSGSSARCEWPYLYPGQRA